MINRDIRNNATDHAATAFTNANIWLPELFRASLQAGAAMITGRTFTNCTLEGPAVILALGGVDFDGCNMGYSGGDVRSLALRPVSPQKVVGALPVQNCRFVSCDFFAVGFTGSEAFIESLLAVRTGEPS